MKRELTVKQKHRYTQQRTILYSGMADFQRMDNHVRISYIEDNGGGTVTLHAYDKMLELERIGTGIHTRLSFINKDDSKGMVISEYGTIELELHTYKYIKKEDVIALDYDIVVNKEVTDGYRIIWNFREGL